MINIKKIVAKNLMSVGNVPIELTLNTHKHNLITGKNGSGKSTILIEALTYALFGKPYRSINLPQLVNTTNKKGMEVKIDFEIDGIEYTIKRGIGPKVFEIYKDGQIIEEDASTGDYQSYLETKILQMSIKTFKQIVVLGTAGFTPFMQLKPAQRREVTEDVLDMQTISIMAAKNKERLSILNSDILQAEHNIQLLTQKKEMLQRLQAETQSANDAAIEEQYDLIRGLTSLMTEAQNAVKEADSQLARLTQALSDGTHQTALPVLYNERGVLQARVTENRKLFSFFQNNHVCPTCTQSIDTNIRDKKIFELDMDTDEAGLRLDEKAQEINALEVHRLRDQKVKVKIQEIESKRAVDLNTAKHHARGIEAAKQKIQELEAKVFKDQTDSLIKLDAMLTKQSDHRLELMNDKYCHTVITSILKDSGVKTLIIDQYMPVINGLINDYLTKMGAVYTFELDSEFNEVVKTRGMENFSYNSFSQGQKFRIDLAILFAWRDLVKKLSGASFNLMIMDEVMDSASDQDGIDALVEILEQSKDFVYIISHGDKIDVMEFDRVLDVRMNGKFSEIETIV